MLGKGILLIVVLLCSWAILLHAEVSREVPGPYKSAFEIGAQDLGLIRKYVIKNEEDKRAKFDGVTCIPAWQPIVSPADFAGIASYIHIPAPAVFAGVKCASKTPSLIAPDSFMGIKLSTTLPELPDFTAVVGYSITSSLIAPDAFSGITSFQK